MEDLASQLQLRFSPDTPIEIATIAVVGIESPASQGSGFFVSAKGHIVTNKHVVRPADSGEWQQQADALRLQREQLQAARRELSVIKGKLNRTEAMLASNRATMENEIGSERRRAEERYRSNLADVQGLQRQYRDSKANYSVSRKAYENANAKYTRLSYSSRVTTEFKIVLKDETELRATLLQVSESYDLALLKLDGYATPFIDASSRVEVSQGNNVYAIGNPLGLRDFVTSGIVTSIQEDVLVTDTQMLPGNSGGPLIDSEGNLLGVSTAVLRSGAIGSELFGAAISSALITSEFGRYLGARTD